MGEITTAHVQQFHDNIILLAQQKDSRLRSRVMTKPITGNAAYFERIGPTEAQIKTTRHSTSPMVDTNYSRRMVTLVDLNWGDAIDPQDAVRMLIDPMGTYTQNAVSSLNRALDDLIIAAATGNASAVSSSLPSANNISSVALTAGQIIDEDFGTANSDLTLEKLIEANRILDSNEVDPDEERTCVFNASAKAALLNTTKVTSSDYQSVKMLSTGQVDTFLGLTFVRSQRLLGSLSSESSPKKILVFARSGLGLAMASDIKTRVAERSDLSFTNYAYAELTAGATRVEEEKVVEVQCYQTA